MIIGYKQEFPAGHRSAGQPTHFRIKIIKGEKKHTLRPYSPAKWRRWRLVGEIHHCVGVRSVNYDNFLTQANPHCYKRIKLAWENETIEVYILPDFQLDTGAGPPVRLDAEKRAVFIENDGFDCEADFVDWFKKDVKKGLGDYLLICFSKLYY